jgi:hypothetical protein
MLKNEGNTSIIGYALLRINGLFELLLKKSKLSKEMYSTNAMIYDLQEHINKVMTLLPRSRVAFYIISEPSYCS